MAGFKNYYRVLNIDPAADEATIKTVFRRLARRYHPDLAPTARAALRFHEIREAYEVLCDREKRRRYDGIYRAQMALRPVAGGRKGPKISRRARGGSAGLGITLDLLGLKLGVAVDATAAAKNQTPRRRPKKR